MAAKRKAKEEPVETVPAEEPIESPLSELTPQQQIFAQEYVKDWNATRSAITAGYSEHTAPQQASRLLRNVKVQEFVNDFVDTHGMSAKEVLARLARMGRGSLEPFLDTGEPLRGEAPKFNLSTETAKQNLDLIKKLKSKTITKITEATEDAGGEGLEIVEIELEIHDPKDALVHLGRHHKLFTDKVEQSGTLTVERKAEDLTDDELAAIIEHRKH